jgi:hypothetical protein
MIPVDWNSLLQNPPQANTIYHRWVDGFHWDSRDQEPKLQRVMTNILRSLHSTHGPVPTHIFENELIAQLSPLRTPGLHAPKSTLSPEQEYCQYWEEFDTDMYEIMPDCAPTPRSRPERAADVQESMHRPTARRNDVLQGCISQTGPVERVSVTVQRQRRDSRVVFELKHLYDFRCQVCSVSIPMGRGRGFYCEAHHIRPLGIPHNGADSSDNILIVCPNHHKTLDYGAMMIDLSRLVLLKHEISEANIRYHNEELQTVA